MEYCFNCGAPMPEGRMRCPRCGAQQPQQPPVDQWQAPPPYAEAEPDYPEEAWEASGPDSQEAPLSVWSYLWSGFCCTSPWSGSWSRSSGPWAAQRTATAELRRRLPHLELPGPDCVIILMVLFYIYIYPYMDQLIAYINQMSAPSPPRALIHPGFLFPFLMVDKQETTCYI